jgi:hypothetical protein
MPSTDVRRVCPLAAVPLMNVSTGAMAASRVYMIAVANAAHGTPARALQCVIDVWTLKHLRVAIYCLWAVGLAGFCAYRFGSTAATMPTPVVWALFGDHKLKVIGEIADANRSPVFVKGRTAAVVFVTSTCRACREKASTIVKHLQRTRAERQLVVVMDQDKNGAIRYANEVGIPPELIVVPADSAEQRNTRVPFVPTMVVRGPERMSAWQGLPSRPQLWIGVLRAGLH